MKRSFKAFRLKDEYLTTQKVSFVLLVLFSPPFYTVSVLISVGMFVQELTLLVSAKMRPKQQRRKRSVNDVLTWQNKKLASTSFERKQKPAKVPKEIN